MADPHLHAIRMIASSIRKTDDPHGHQIETARTNLFKALRSESYTEAWDWLNTLDVGLGCLEADGHPARAAKVLRILHRNLSSALQDERYAEAMDWLNGRGHGWEGGTILEDVRYCVEQEMAEKRARVG